MKVLMRLSLIVRMQYRKKESSSQSCKFYSEVKEPVSFSNWILNSHFRLYSSLADDYGLMTEAPVSLYRSAN